MTMEPATLTLTTDELLAILQVMGTTTIDGLGNPLANLSEVEQAARLNAGAETLLQRGLCRIDGDQLVLDDMMVAFVGACVVPEATMLLAVVQPDGSRSPHYFHITPYIAVEHQSLRPGVHLFSHLPHRTDLSNRVASLLAPVAVDRTRSARGEPRCLSDADLNIMLQHLQQGETGSARTIVEHEGWPASEIDQLIADLQQGSSWVGLVGWSLRKDAGARGTSAILYAGAERYWLFTPLADTPELLSVSSPDGSRAVASFVELAAPLLAIAAE